MYTAFTYLICASLCIVVSACWIATKRMKALIRWHRRSDARVAAFVDQVVAQRADALAAEAGNQRIAKAMQEPSLDLEGGPVRKGPCGGCVASPTGVYARAVYGSNPISVVYEHCHRKGIEGCANATKASWPQGLSA